MRTGVIPSFVPDPDLYPFESRWFDGPHGRMHYVDEGPRDAPPIVMCHGNPTWSFLYSELIIRLRDRYRCIAADLIGMGLSERPINASYTLENHGRSLTALVDHLGLQGFVLVAQDWGGPTGLSMAVERAERVRGLVLGDTWCWFKGTPLFRTWSGVSRVPPVKLLLNRTGILVDVALRGMTHRRLTEREMEHYRAVQATPDLRPAMATAFPRQIISARPALERLERDVAARLSDKPALLIVAGKSRGFRPADRTRLHGYFADRTILELPRASHYFQHDAPDEIAAAVHDRFGPNPASGSVIPRLTS